MLPNQKQTQYECVCACGRVCARARVRCLASELVSLEAERRATAGSLAEELPIVTSVIRESAGCEEQNQSCPVFLSFSWTWRWKVSSPKYYRFEMKQWGCGKGYAFSGGGAGRDHCLESSYESVRVMCTPHTHPGASLARNLPNGNICVAGQKCERSL